MIELTDEQLFALIEKHSGKKYYATVLVEETDYRAAYYHKVERWIDTPVALARAIIAADRALRPVEPEPVAVQAAKSIRFGTDEQRMSLLKASTAARHLFAPVPVPVHAPVPTGWKLVPVEPTQDMLDAPTNAWSADAKITWLAMLASAPEFKVVQSLIEIADTVPMSECSCHTCSPVTWDNQRMVLCATCGNKRCPHARDHANSCTGSNEPGQKGSAYESGE
jgi:hypothetical protein